MNTLIKIFLPILAVLILVPTLGININTHLCGQSEDVSKSLVIPGILSAEECDKCHEVVVVKSCCSAPKAIVADDSKEDNCCEDILEYNSFDYLTIAPYVQTVDFSTLSFIAFENHSLFSNETNEFKATDIRTRLRPYVADIVPLHCSYLI